MRSHGGGAGRVADIEGMTTAKIVAHGATLTTHAVRAAGTARVSVAGRAVPLGVIVAAGSGAAVLLAVGLWAASWRLGDESGGAGVGAGTGGGVGSGVAYRSMHYLALPSGKVNIGLPQRFHEPGVYEQYRDRGFFLVTHPSGFLAAISAVCPHDHSGVTYDDKRDQYRCPTCGSRFDRNGLVLGSSAATRPLERLRLTRIGFYGRKTDALYVDPGTRYRQDENEWSKPPSMHALSDAGE